MAAPSLGTHRPGCAQAGLALPALERVAELQPRSINAIYTLAQLVEARGELARAAGLYERVLMIEPTDQDAAFLLARIRAHLGPERESLQLSALAHRLSPDDNEARQLRDRLRARARARPPSGAGR